VNNIQRSELIDRVHHLGPGIQGVGSSFQVSAL